MRIKMDGIVLDCPDAHALAEFYERLLGWPITTRRPDWVHILEPLTDGTGFSFQTEEDYVPPVWPEEPGAQQKMIHIDFLVDDLDVAVAHALKCGAVLAPTQFIKEGLRVFFDPAGHPFCFFVAPSYQWPDIYPDIH